MKISKIDDPFSVCLSFMIKPEFHIFNRIRNAWSPKPHQNPALQLMLILLTLPSEGEDAIEQYETGQPWPFSCPGPISSKLGFTPPILSLGFSCLAPIFSKAEVTLLFLALGRPWGRHAAPCPVLLGARAALEAVLLLVAGSAWDTRGDVERRPLPQTMAEAWEETVLREEEVRTKNSQNHTISCLNVFMCFVLTTAGAGEKMTGRVRPGAGR